MNSIINRISVTLTIALTFIVMAGCSQEIVNEDISPMDSSLLGLSEDTQPTTTVTTVTTKATESTTSTEVTTTEPTIKGYTIDELTSIAQELYTNACEKYQNVLVDCYYGVDFGDYIVDESGTKYFLVTDEYYNSLETIFQDWHTVFSSSLDDLVNSKYFEYNGSLYGYTAIEQKNTNYNSTDLEYYSNDDNKVTFKATCNYSSGEKIFNFSIEYSSSEKVWRVSKFTMPY
ncbi:MAG: hypothetical protein LUG94_08625 [Ruminococcus sp.]|nr:hypothetical protein [Ruminococcus sp.]